MPFYPKIKGAAGGAGGGGGGGGGSGVIGVGMDWGLFRAPAPAQPQQTRKVAPVGMTYKARTMAPAQQQPPQSQQQANGMSVKGSQPGSRGGDYDHFAGMYDQDVQLPRVSAFKGKAPRR